jgi:hypothetical protein
MGKTNRLKTTLESTTPHPQITHSKKSHYPKMAKSAIITSAIRHFSLLAGNLYTTCLLLVHYWLVTPYFRYPLAEF